MNFLETLNRLNMTKTQLAKELGVAAPTVTRWGNNPPQYVNAFLNERLLRTEAADKLEAAITKYRQQIEDAVDQGIHLD